MTYKEQKNKSNKTINDSMTVWLYFSMSLYICMFSISIIVTSEISLIIIICFIAVNVIVKQSYGS